MASLANILRQGSEADPEPLVVEFRGGDEASPAIFAVAAPGVRAIGYGLLARHLENGKDSTNYKHRLQSFKDGPSNSRSYEALRGSM